MSKDVLFETQEQPVALATDDGRFGGRFVIDALLGSGSAGTMFRAKDRSSGHSVALKVLPPLEGRAAEQFLLDAEFLIRLNHPAIAHHIAHGLTPQNQPYLAVEWLDGENLGQSLARGKLAPVVVARLGARVLEALAAAQRQNLFHGDLKPTNLFLPDQDPARVVVLDFGVGLCRSAFLSLPRTGVMTSPCYLAPEQVRGSASLDGRADIFALGCILFECATGQCLLPEQPWGSKLPYEGLIGRSGIVPQPLRAILERMLAMDPAGRPADPERLACELLEVARVLEGIETRFAIAVSPRGDFRVLFAKGPREAPHTLAGQAVPFFGRQRELDLLEGLWHEVCELSVARAIIISAPAGGGKTRLRQELCERIQRQRPAFELLVGGGDPLYDGSPFALLGPAVLGTAGLTGSESAEVKRQRLIAEMEHFLPPGRAQRIAAFLGEMAHIPFPDGFSGLRAARLDPRLMADQMRMAWLDWLEATCNRHPVMLVLEDMHWGDAASVALVETSLRVLRNKPLLVIALAQPEMDQRFMHLWRECAPQRLHLAPLSARNGQRLVEYLSEALSPAEVRAMVERAQGNPLCLEESMRVILSGRQLDQEADTLPEMIQARLQTLEPGSKLVLGACAVLGRRLRADAIAAVVESDAHLEIERCLDHLEEHEILFSHTSLAGREMDFRHTLVRQTAYDMMSRDERRLGHLWAGRFLEQIGEPDARVLAEHFERGQDKPHALHWLRRAAGRTLCSEDATGTAALLDRAMNLGATEEEMAGLRAMEAQSLLWQEEYREAERAAQIAVATRVAETRWRSLSSLLAALAAQSKTETMGQLLAPITEPPEETELFGIWLDCLANALPYLLTEQSAEIRETFIGHLEKRQDPARADAPWQGQIESLLAHLALAKGQPAQAQVRFTRAALHHASLENHRAECEARANLGRLFLQTGQLDKAEDCLRPLLVIARRLELNLLLARMVADLACVLAYRGSWEEARDLGRQALSMAEARHDRRLRGHAEAGLSLTELLAGEYPSAEKFASVAIASFEVDPRGKSFAEALLARAQLAQGRKSEALHHAREAYDLLESPRVIDGYEGAAHLALAECLLATGDTFAAREILRNAQARLRDLADTISEPEARQSFVSGLPDHARLLQLCRQEGLDT